MALVEDSMNRNKFESFRSREDEIRQRGKLKIFFGIAPGVGKTYSMLESASVYLSKGFDIVIGGIDTHNSTYLNDLVEKFEVIPYRQIEDNQPASFDIDVKAIISRHPYLVIIDNLAHKNTSNSHHLKRYLDVEELLDNGINVYSTLDILHIESCKDNITQITDIRIDETLPDEIFEEADDVQLIDISPNELLDRFNEGKIQFFLQSVPDFQIFFRKGNIIALREMSLRLLADREDKQLRSYMREKRIEGPWKSGTHLLVLVGPSKSSAKLIRWAKTVSYTMKASLIALHVEDTQILNEIQQEQLTKNIDLARQLGADIMVTSGDDLVSTTLEVARRENITQIVIGKSGKQSFFSSLFKKDDFVNRLLRESGEIDIHVIEPGFENKQYRKKLISDPDFSSSSKDYLFVSFAMFVAIVLCFPLSTHIGYQSVSFILLFVILILALLFRLGPVLFASALTAISWNFFFIPPQFAIKISQSSDLLTFLMFFVVAFITGSLTSKVRKQVVLTKKREEKTNALFHLANQLSDVDHADKIIRIAKEDIKKYFDVETYFLLQNDKGVLSDKEFENKGSKIAESEYDLAQWVYRYSRKAGRYTDTVASSEFTIYPLIGAKTKLGVVLLKMSNHFNGETELFWNIFLTEIANALEHHQFAEFSQKIKLTDNINQLYQSLTNMIMEDMSKPVASIIQASKKLCSDNELAHNIDLKKLYNEIYSASVHLNNEIDNMFNISAIELGKINVNIDWHDIKDIFNKVVNDLKEELSLFRLDIVVPITMPLVRMDSKLMKRVLYNLIENSCRYSQSNTTIRLKAFYDNGTLVIQEMDRGMSFELSQLPLAFTKFNKVRNQLKDKSGCNLFIVKKLIDYQNGIICVENRQHGGIRFTIKIPTEASYPGSIEAQN